MINLSISLQSIIGVLTFKSKKGKSFENIVYKLLRISSRYLGGGGVDLLALYVFVTYGMNVNLTLNLYNHTSRPADH